jgi:DNA-binding MarR family transcriptional regulator
VAQIELGFGDSHHYGFLGKRKWVDFWRALAYLAPTMPEQDITEYLAYLLASAHRRMRLGLAQSIASEDVTEEQWRILQVLSDEQGRSMGDLAERVLMNHPALTKNIDKLVSRNLVQRAADASDSRKVLVYISDHGLETVARLKKSVDEHHDALAGTLGARKTEQLKELLKAFIEESAPQS